MKKYRLISNRNTGKMVVIDLMVENRKVERVALHLDDDCDEITCDCVHPDDVARLFTFKRADSLFSKLANKEA